MMTEHRVNIGNSQNLKEIENESVNLIVTSPPYPMIEMWDEVYDEFNIQLYIDSPLQFIIMGINLFVIRIGHLL